MPRAKPGLSRRKAAKPGGEEVLDSDTFDAGWLQMAGRPEEPLVELAGHAWSTVYFGMKSKTPYKEVKKTGLWYRFSAILSGLNRNNHS